MPSFMPELEPTAAAAALGVPEQVTGLRLVQELLPKMSGMATPNTYSGNFGLDAFPLHTDLAHWAKPPRYLLLRCERGDPDARTHVIDGRSIVAAIGTNSLTRCLARPRRPMNGEFQLLPILQESSDRDQQCLRWDSIYLRPSNASALAIFQQIGECLSRLLPTSEALLNKGDTLLLDNWRVLHGRSPVQNAASPRKIYRVYLQSLT